MTGKPVNLALQGGGAHGAFTWGVLDTLLEDGRLAIKAISGTSAGAMNAAAFAAGYLEDGAEGARRRLDSFWREISREGRLSPAQRPLLKRFLGGWPIAEPAGLAMIESWTRLMSPYDANPLNLNPLRELIDRLIPFERLRTTSDIRLFVAATHVRTGELRIFDNAALNADAVMASACLPQIFQAVEIDGEAYWDGGYLANPPLFPLLEAGLAPDTILVQINPVEIGKVPESASAIAGRLNEITFNASLLGELRAIALLQRRAEAGDSLHDIRLHRIALETARDLGAASKLNTGWDFLVFLRNQGRRAARDFLDRHFEAIGAASTLDLSRA